MHSSLERRFVFSDNWQVGTALPADWMRPARSNLTIGERRGEVKPAAAAVLNRQLAEFRRPPDDILRGKARHVNPKNFRSQSRERRRYWQSMPLPAFLWLALSGSLAFVSVWLAYDLDTGLQWPYWWVLLRTAMFSGVFGGALIVSLRSRRRSKASLPILVVVFAVLFAFQRIERGLPANRALLSPGYEGVRHRLEMDGTLLSLAPVLAWIVLVLFAGTQGVKHVRTRTELELAEKLQQTLAPPLNVRNPAYEVHGRSAPSSQMGGDLLDAVTHEGTLACYIGDVAGHGIQAGVFMGMVRSSARTALLQPIPLDRLLANLNQVLFEIKSDSPTYVTFACLRCGEGGKVEYALAGHEPILHYHARTKAVTPLAMSQFPLGLFAHATFTSGVVEVEPGDILTLLTDGLLEVTNAAGEEFGQARIADILLQNAARPLPDLTERIFTAVARHGPQQDDQTLVLVRAAAS